MTPLKKIDRKQLVERLIVVTQKTRSNTEEIMESFPAGMKIAHDLFPGLFSDPGDLNIMKSLLSMSEKEHITGQDVYNILLVVHKVPAIPIMYLHFYDEELPEPSIQLITEDFNAQN